ncbi:MAG: inositol monophosphatase family protein, partial [Pseudomonadota bacterium]
MRPDPQDVAKIIAETAQREMLPRFGRLATSSVYEKSGPNDLVTDVDYAMESALRSAFAELCPDADFIGEERAAADPAVMEGLAGPGRFWIVDPLDGTRNFVRGAAEFGTIVAFVEDGVTTMGWIYAAPDDAFAIAVKGSGASWTGPRPEKPRGDGGPRGMRSVGWLSDEFGHIGRNLRTEFRTDGSHCSAYAYIELLRGGFDFAV